MFGGRKKILSANKSNFSLHNMGKDLKKTNKLCHVRLHQRNGRKSLTTIQGLSEKLDIEKITKTLKKDFCCNGCISEDLVLGKIIQLQGDQRENVMKFFLEEEILPKKKIKIHGV
jgi:translation initiation factor 1